ncbi:O-methyltransferase, partial [Mycena albidolilacea]
MQSISALRRYSDIISTAVDDIERAYTSSGIALPSLDDSGPFDENDPAEVLRQNAAVSAAAKNIIAAAAHISATVSDPRWVAVNMAKSYHLSSCLRAASELDVVEILREAGPKGANASDIATLSGVDEGLMARILRLLATHHVFREVSPGVFTNNRISSTLDKGKSVSVLPATYVLYACSSLLVGSSGTAAMAEHTADIACKGAAYLVESMSKPNPRLKLPFNVAFATEKPFFTWMQEPQNRYPVTRQVQVLTWRHDAGFDWNQLPAGGRIVDVGGGIGHVSLTIAKKYPHLRIVNQDLGQAIELSKAHWAETFVEHLDKQMVEFQVHDFLAPQPVKDAAVFFLRFILHNWADEQAAVILRHLRAAALPTTRLVIAENILPFAARVDSEDSNLGEEEEDRIPGAARPVAEVPLLPNWGTASANLYFLDLSMHILVGGVERTIDGFRGLLAKGGWRLVEVRHAAGLPLSHLVAAP